MTSAELIEELQVRGVRLQARGDRLRYVPLQAVDDELLAEMREHKSDLLALARFADWLQEHWPGPVVISALVN